MDLWKGSSEAVGMETTKASDIDSPPGKAGFVTLTASPGSLLALPLLQQPRQIPTPQTVVYININNFNLPAGEESKCDGLAAKTSEEKPPVRRPLFRRRVSIHDYPVHLNPFPEEDEDGQATKLKEEESADPDKGRPEIRAPGRPRRMRSRSLTTASLGSTSDHSLSSSVNKALSAAVSQIHLARRRSETQLASLVAKTKASSRFFLPVRRRTKSAENEGGVEPLPILSEGLCDAAVIEEAPVVVKRKKKRPAPQPPSLDEAKPLAAEQQVEDSVSELLDATEVVSTASSSDYHEAEG